MYGISSDGVPFRVFARREGGGSDNLVIRFECGDGMGVLGIRQVGRTDPPPSAAYEEAEIDPNALRAGRFVHVLGSGQRQSYALSRIAVEVAQRLPDDAWVELQPHTEYGFRYLVVPDEALTKGGAVAVQVAAGAEGAADDAPEVVMATPKATRPQPVAKVDEGRGLPPRQTPLSPALAESALEQLDRDAAVRFLREEMAKVEALHLRVVELEQALEQSRGRERDLLEVLAKWQRG